MSGPLSIVSQPERTTERIVPATGLAAWLTALTAFAMAALAVAALCATFAAGRLAERWSSELARAATVEIAATAADPAAEAAAALAVLEQTAGIASARMLTEAEQSALLAPWLGADLRLERLPVPILIVIEETPAGPDRDTLALRLAAEAPAARYDDHGRWRRPMIEAANMLVYVAGGALLLILAATAAMVTLAARAAMAANAQVIGVLRLIGATDRFIARAFVRRFTARTLLGALAGTVVAALAFAALPRVETEGAFATGLAPVGAQWALLVIVPLLAGLTAWLATRASVALVLRDLEEA
ncbi:MAG: cell division protein FtsX [Rubricella sp.]